MNNKRLFLLWSALYILCLGLSFISAPGTLPQVLMQIFSICFFVPGGLLLWQAIRQENKALLRCIRLLCCLSLVLTLVFIIGSMLSVTASSVVAGVVQVLLLIVSVPMGCSGYPLLSIFLWAALLTATFLKKR